MIEMACPWCEEQVLQPFLELTTPEATFTCADCGTTVELVDDPVELDLAA